MSRGWCSLLRWGFQLWHRHTAQSRGGSSPQKEGEMCFWKQRSLLISCCSSCRPFAGQLIELRLLFPASEPSPAPFLLASLSACSFLLHYSHPAPLSAALEQPFLLRVRMSPSSSASRAAVPARCGGGRWDMGYSPLPHVPPFPGPAPQPAFVTEAGLSAGDCESLVAVARSPLCIVRTERADGIQQITVRDCGNVLRPLCIRINRNLLGRK